MSDFFEMIRGFHAIGTRDEKIKSHADVIWQCQPTKQRKEPGRMIVNIPKCRTDAHGRNARVFFDSASTSIGFSEMPADTRKPQLNPVFEMPYGAVTKGNKNDAS